MCYSVGECAYVCLMCVCACVVSVCMCVCVFNVCKCVWLLCVSVNVACIYTVYSLVSMRTVSADSLGTINLLFSSLAI